jgi:hypothetical protein
VHVYPFAGFVVCAHCGTRLRIQGNGESRYVYYRDAAHVRQIACPVQGRWQVRQDRLVQHLGLWLHSLHLPDTWRELVTHSLQQASPRAHAAWRQEYDRLLERRRRILKQARAGYLSDQDYAAELLGVDLALRQLASRETPISLQESLGLGEQLAEIAAHWGHASAEQQRVWVQMLLTPAGMLWDLETQQLAALVPRPALLPFRQFFGWIRVAEEHPQMWLLTSWQPETHHLGEHSPLQVIPTTQRFLADEEVTPLPTATLAGASSAVRGTIPSSAWPHLLERLTQGASLHQVAEEYGVTYGVMRRTELRARAALNLPPRARAHPAQWKIPETEWESVLERIDQGVALAQIAREYGVSKSAVLRMERAARMKFQRAERAAHAPGNIASTE